jgi:hypothetical protein
MHTVITLIECLPRRNTLIPSPCRWLGRALPLWWLSQQVNPCLICHLIHLQWSQSQLEQTMSPTICIRNDRSTFEHRPELSVRNGPRITASRRASQPTNLARLPSRCGGLMCLHFPHDIAFFSHHLSAAAARGQARWHRTTVRLSIYRFGCVARRARAMSCATM